MFLLSHYYVHQTLLGAGHTAEDKKKKKKTKIFVFTVIPELIL